MVRAFFFLVILLIACTGSVSYATLQSHEAAHVQINKSFGVDSVVEFNGLSARTIPVGEFPDQETQNAAYVSHSVNEAVAYNLLPVLFAIFTVALLMLFVLFDISKSLGANK